MEPMLLILMFLIPAFAQDDTSVEINLIHNEGSSEILEKLKIIEQKILDIESSVEINRGEGIAHDARRDEVKKTEAWAHTLWGTLTSTLISVVIGAVPGTLLGVWLGDRRSSNSKQTSEQSYAMSMLYVEKWIGTVITKLPHSGS